MLDFMVCFMGKPERLVLIGFDAPIASRVYRYAVEGELPNIGRLIENGVYFENCLVPHPTITPPNWTTIATGAWPGTHGITCFNMHKPGMPLDETYPAFDSRDCEAEYLWEAAGRDGALSILVNYPSTWPPRGDKVVQVGGGGLSMNEWRIGVKGGYRCSLCECMLFSTEEYPLASVLSLREAEGWVNLPSNVERVLEAEVKPYFPQALYRVEPVSWWLLLLDYGGGFQEAILSERKDFEKAFARLRRGEWSGLIKMTFKTERGRVKAAFKAKLLELSEDGSRVKLLISPIGALEGWGHPEEVCSLLEFEDLYPVASHGFYSALNLGWIDVDTFLEAVDMEHRWLAEASRRLMDKYPWKLFFMHAHCPDWAYHAFINRIDPSTAKDPAEAELYGRVELEFYRSLDRMVGRILEGVSLEDTLVVLVSDHGAKPTTRRFDPRVILEKAGLLVYKVENGERKVDWSRTKAIPQRSSYIYVNLKGRDPQGIVDPGEYDKVRDEIIKALYDYTDPETGLKPVVFALKKEDAMIIGLHGDRVGDVVYGLRAEYGGQHGVIVTTAEYGIGSLKGLLIMAGPGVKKGVVVDRTVWLTDVAPTICHLMELPIPKQAEGGIIYQALEDPDQKTKELKKLRRNYQRLLEAYKKEAELTHTYFMEEN